MHYVYAKVFGDGFIEFEVDGPAATWTFIIGGARAYDLGWILSTAEMTCPLDVAPEISLSGELNTQLSIGSPRA
jgi:hypothetical protein